MSQPVAVGEFEGPMGLLLELVERGRMQVTSISVAEITTQYLARLDTLPEKSPEELSDFAGLGARLLYIKSAALLPSSDVSMEPDELALLNRELDEYRTMQAAASLLKNQARTRTWQRAASDRLDAAELPTPNITLDALTAAFSLAISQLAPPQGKGIIMPHVTVERQTARIMHRLKAGSFRLEELLGACSDRIEIVTTFLALLELMRTDTILVSQDAPFGPVQVEAANG
jgi:segregation and condensation protein A